MVGYNGDRESVSVWCMARVLAHGAASVASGLAAEDFGGDRLRSGSNPPASTRTNTVSPRCERKRIGYAAPTLGFGALFRGSQISPRPGGAIASPPVRLDAATNTTGSNTMKWYIRQLLPLRYDCHGYSHTEGQPFHVRWRMWFGRCFDIKWRWATSEGWGG